MPQVDFEIVNTRPEHFDGIIALCEAVYQGSAPWSRAQLTSHLEVFPEGQFVAIERGSGRVVGIAASLIVLWDDYEFTYDWRAFTANGYFTNHDPAAGRTLYGAEVMSDPACRGGGIGKALYRARRELVERLGLLRIRAGARLRGYHRYAAAMSAEEYTLKVVRGELSDPTVSFQLAQGFHVMAVVEGYLRHDPESLGYAAVIEWINAAVAKPSDWAHRDPKYNV
ncbi:MAG: GNAT family N-acetyltransferase [Acidobacteriota bacterium]|nr:GNAT family N-acetyltransferase [Acidobacteriota bacterium]